MFLETMDLLARGLIKNRNSRRLYPPSYSFLIDSLSETIESCIEYDIPLSSSISFSSTAGRLTLGAIVVKSIITGGLKIGRPRNITGSMRRKKGAVYRTLESEAMKEYRVQITCRCSDLQSKSPDLIWTRPH